MVAAVLAKLLAADEDVAATPDRHRQRADQKPDRRGRRGLRPRRQA